MAHPLPSPQPAGQYRDPVPESQAQAHARERSASAENLRFLRQVLDHFRFLKSRYGMRNLTMAEGGAGVLAGTP